MAKTKVFVSFNFDNDKTLKEFIIGHYVIGLESGREPTLRKRCQTSGLSASQAIESTF